MSAWAILVAAGAGTRLGARGPKAFEPLGGRPMVAHPLITLARVPEIDGIVLVLPADPGVDVDAMLATSWPSKRVVRAVGGPTRQASVRAGLEAVPSGVERIIVHDAARPLVTVSLVQAALAGLKDAAGAVVAVAERDTLKRVEGDRIAETVPRDDLWRAQTPQAFRADVLRAAHARATDDGVEGTDDAVLVERLGERVVVVPGDERNMKITRPEDLAIAEWLLAGRTEA